MALIHLENVSLTFRVQRGGRVKLKEFVLRKILPGRDSGQIKIEALKNIDLTILEGQRVGIIGHNGSGKSTLLRVLAGIYCPTQGTRTVRGELDTLLDIGMGIEPLANGWDNIAYRFYLRGKTPADVKRLSQEIADFSELGEHMNVPVRYYSSGMYVRFAFSLATAINPEILLLDEVFGAGDLAFREKAQARMFQLIDQARLMVFVSHDLDTIATMCNRVIWLDQGRIVMDDHPDEVIAQYKECFCPPNQASDAA